jgi:hypothetical protein
MDGQKNNKSLEKNQPSDTNLTSLIILDNHDREMQKCLSLI